MKKFSILMLLFLFHICLLVKAENLPANKIYEQKAGSVLFIETQDTAGSGIVLKEDGTFVTCFHVIANADYIKVRTNDGSEYKVCGYKYINPDTDVAILTIKTPKKFVPAAVFDSKKIKVGDTVYAIANPKGLKFVFSNGMVNQISKEYIQFSAPASPGSSGGALFNQEGMLIGMITSQFNPSSAQNINFALPVSYFMPFLDKKKKVNSKGINWVDFVASTSKQNDVKSYIEFGLKEQNMSMVYKYLRGSNALNDIKSYDYAFYGSIALSSFLKTFNNMDLLNDASKWFALSITSNKNLELSYYGLVLSLFLNPETKVEDIDLFIAKLNKYKKTSNVFFDYAKQLLESSSEDIKCSQNSLSGFSKYLTYLTAQVYTKK